jgi:uncharacterized protein YuzE
MKIKFDKSTDILYVQFTNSEIFESDEEKPGMIIDYDKNGNIVGIEYLEASKKIDLPDKVSYEIVE